VILTEHDVPRWVVVVTFLLSLVGLGLSLYLTIAHFTGTKLAGCPVTGTVNCSVVTTSAQSYFLGVPVAVLGLATYVVMTALNSPWAWRARTYWVHLARFVLAILSMCFVLWLVYAELMIIKHVCEYCTGVHLVTFALLIVLTRVSPIQLGWTSSRAQ
jgi:uncharacterized membrane protein